MISFRVMWKILVLVILLTAFLPHTVEGAPATDGYASRKQSAHGRLRGGGRVFILATQCLEHLSAGIGRYQGSSCEAPRASLSGAGQAGWQPADLFSGTVCVSEMFKKNKTKVISYTYQNNEYVRTRIRLVENWLRNDSKDCGEGF